MKRALFALALLVLPTLAFGQASIPNYEFSSTGVDYPADPNNGNVSLQGTLGQTFATVDLPTNQNQNLALAGFFQTGVKFRYLAQVAFQEWVGVLSNIPLNVEMFNNIDNTLSDTVAAVTDTSGNAFVDSWINPAFTAAMSVKGPIWLRQSLALTPPANVFTDYPSASYTLLAGDADNSNVVDFDDLTILAIAYNTATGDPLYDVHADFNGDGQVEFADLTLLAINYNLSGDN